MNKICVFLALFLLFVMPVFAEPSFQAQVSVETEAENQAGAKDMALKQAYRKAFLEVAQKVATPKQYVMLEDLTDDQLAHFVRETVVLNEGGAGKSYHAEFNVSINGALLKQFLEENEAAEISENSQVLIVPLMTNASENIWRQVWLDQGVIGAGQLVFQVWPQDLKETDTYESLRQQTNMKNIYLVDADVLNDQEAQIRLQEWRTGISERFRVMAPASDVLTRAVSEVVRRISLQRPAPQSFDANQGGEITVVYAYSRLKDWLDTEKKLKAIENIKKVATDGLGNGIVQMKLKYKGSLEALKSTLEENMLTLKEQGSYYILK